MLNILYAFTPTLKKNVTITLAVICFAAVSAIAYGLFSFNSPIQAKLDQDQLSTYSDKLVVIKGYDGALQTFVITQPEFTAIQPDLIDSSSDTNDPVNGTLENVEDFLLLHSNSG